MTNQAALALSARLVTMVGTSSWRSSDWALVGMVPGYIAPVSAVAPSSVAPGACAYGL